MHRAILTLACGAALLSSALADTHKLPEEKPIASIAIPDAWETDEIDNGIEATSDDGEVYLAVEKTEAGKVGDALDQAMKYLKSKGVTVTDSSMKQTEAKLNGMDTVDISWDGKDEEGPAKISLTVVSVTEKEGLLLIYWASPEGEKKHQEELSAIAKSIKKA
jgi:hypothetical protein